MKAVTLIYNPVAGHNPARRARQMEAVAELLEKSGVEVEVARTAAPGHASELARRAAAGGAETLLACGGDGTLNEIINGMAPGTAALGVLPGGTANVLAKELRLPHNPVRAARQCLRWRPRRIALGRAFWLEGGAKRERYFATVAGVGFDAYLARRLAARKRSAAVADYVAAALTEVWRYSFPEIVCNTAAGARRGAFAVVLRSRRYAGWLRLAPQADLFDGRMRLCLFRSARPARYLAYAAAVALGRHLNLSDVELAEGTQFDCASAEAGRPIEFELDGEYAGLLPATFQLVPDALTVLAP